MQYYLFPGMAVDELRSSQDKLRKGMFARHNALERRINTLEDMVGDLLQVIMTLQKDGANDEKVIVPMFGELMEISK